MKSILMLALVSAALLTSSVSAQEAEPNSTSATANGESLFAEMLSRQNSIKDADTMFAKVFAGHREDLLLEAGVALREDGKPAIELDPNTGEVTATVRLAVNEKAWNAWVANAQKCFGEMSEKSEPASTHHSYDDRWDGPEIVVGDHRYFFTKDYAPTMRKQLEDVPERQWVRVALVDKGGWTIAAEYMKTSAFQSGYHCSPLGFYARECFIQTDPVTKDVVFEGLSLADLKATAKVVCLVGEYNELITTGTDQALSYRKNHPNKTISIGDVSFELAQLSPRLLVGTTEVTQALWEAVMGENPSKTKGPDKPVENVSWNDCQSFLEKLNAWPGIRESGLVFRLPLEEEWEYACRAGATGDYCRLADGTEITADTLGTVAWFDRNAGGETHPVGHKKPNAFGLYDIHGNVLEWTSTLGIIRGSGWNFPDCSSKLRFFFSPDTREDNVGFRLCASGRAD